MPFTAVGKTPYLQLVPEYIEYYLTNLKPNQITASILVNCFSEIV